MIFINDPKVKSLILINSSQEVLIGTLNMNIGVPTSILDSGRLSTHWLLRRFPKIKLFRVTDTDDHVRLVKESIRGKSIGIYIHIPYCKSICMFCPYFRQVLRSYNELEEYLNSLLNELSLYGKLLKDLDLRVIEIHVGGGTPSLVSPKFYRKFLDVLSEFFNVSCGIGIEVNPEDFKDLRIVEDYYSNGIDEVSIGIQSFDDRILESINRKHSPKDNVVAVENSIKTGFKWVNVDLMFLTPNIKDYIELGLKEKLEIFRRDLEKSLELGVHQITYYATIIPKYSPGYKLINYGKLYQEVEAINYFLEEALKFIEEHKLHLVRIYSIARKQYEYATVNLEMVGPLIGLGASTWSNTGYYQYINIHDVNSYIRSLKNNQLPVIYARKLSKDSIAWRLFFDQLTTTIIRDEVFKSLGIEIPLTIKTYLKLMELSKLVKRFEDGYKLTKYGIIEVYKMLMNYVIEVPIKVTTESLALQGGDEDL